MNTFDPVTQDSPIVDPEYPTSKSPVVFYNNGSKILGTIFLAAGKEPHATAILLCGFPGNESNADIAYMLRRQGFNVLTFYSRGSWGSQGIYSWENVVSDTLAAYNFLKEGTGKEQFKINEKKIFFIGHSMGGFSALYNSIFLDNVKNICAIAPFNAGYFGKFLNTHPEIKLFSIQKMQPSMEFVNCSSAELLLNELIMNSDKWDLINYIEKLKEKNLLIIGSRYDTTSPLDIHYNPLMNKLKVNNPKLKTTVLETGHSFSDKRIQLMRLISDWVNLIKF